MEKELISIIIPVYNVKSYINECLDSVINQTYKNLEIILVDDGSTDGCGEICDKYMAKDNRISVIHKNNGGLSSARNAGLKVTTGTYIGFVDSDDYIDKHMYEKLVNALNNNNAEIAVCGYNYLHPQYDNNANFNKDNFNLSGKEAICKTFFEMPYMYAAWNKLYKAALLKNFKFPNCYYEDLNSLYTVYCEANVVSFINEPLYFYRHRENSIHESFFTKDTKTKIQDTINALIKMSQYEKLSEYKQYFLYGKIWDYISEFFVYLSSIEIKYKNEIINYLFNVLYDTCSHKYLGSVNIYNYIWRFLFRIKDINHEIHKHCIKYIKNEIVSNCKTENLTKFEKIKISTYIKFPILFSNSK